MIYKIRFKDQNNKAVVFVSNANDTTNRKGYIVGRLTDNINNDKPNLIQRILNFLFWDDRCESCKKGYNGRYGNGYQPCGCKPTGERTPPTDMGDD